MWALEEKKFKPLPGERSKELLWYQQVDEDMVRAELDASFGTRYDDEARRLSKLFAVGSDSSNVARHLVRMERARIAKGPQEGGLNFKSALATEHKVSSFGGFDESSSLSTSMSANKSMSGGSATLSTTSMRSPTRSQQLKQKRKVKPNRRAKNSLTLTSNDSVNEPHAVTLAQKLPGGRFYTPALPDPYDARNATGLATRIRDAHGGIANISGRLCSKSDVLYRPPAVNDDSHIQSDDISGGADTRKSEKGHGGASMPRSPSASVTSSSYASRTPSASHSHSHSHQPSAVSAHLASLMGDENRYRHTYDHLRGVHDLYSDSRAVSTVASTAMSPMGKSNSYASGAAADGDDVSLPDDASHMSDLTGTTGMYGARKAASHTLGSAQGAALNGTTGSMYTRSGTAHVSFDHVAQAADQHLAGCGRLRLADELTNAKLARPVVKGLEKQRDFLARHGEWLEKNGNAAKMPKEQEEKNIFLTMFGDDDDDDAGAVSVGGDESKEVSGDTSRPSTTADTEGGEGGGDGEVEKRNVMEGEAATVTTADPHPDDASKATQSTWSTFDWSAAERGDPQPPKGERKTSKSSAEGGAIKGSLTSVERAAAQQAAFDHADGMDASTFVSSRWEGVADVERPDYVPSLKALVGTGGAKPNPSPHKSTTYQEGYHKFLNLTDDVMNPWRSTTERNTNSKDLKTALSGLVGQEAPLDPVQYDAPVVVSQVGDVTVAVKRPPDRNRPTRDLIRQAHASMTRRNMLAYDTRVVETAVVIKALQDSRLPAPGMAAIVDLHFHFMDAAAMNPNPWVIHRHQFTTVMERVLPWVSNEVIGRLFSAYDPDHTGVMRFVRLSATMVAGSRPQMADLIGLLSEDTRGFKYAGEVVILKLIHFFYEQCEGGKKHAVHYHDEQSKYRKAPVSQSEMLSDGDGVGMRLQDLNEALSCCAMSVEEQMRMEEKVEYLTQDLFDTGQRSDIIAGDIYKESHRETRKEEKKMAQRHSAALGEVWEEQTSDSLSSMAPTLPTYFSFDISEGSERTGLPGDAEFFKSLDREKQRTAAEKNWRRQSGRRRQWTNRIAAKVRGEEVHLAPGEASLLEGASGGGRGFEGRNEDGGETDDKSEVGSSLFQGGRESMWSSASVVSGAGVNPKGKSGGLPSPTPKTQGRPSTLARAGAKSFTPTTIGSRSASGSLARANLKGPASTAVHGLPQASMVLKHQSLRAVKYIPRIGKAELVEAAKKHEGVLEEFHSQVKKLREVMLPYALNGSITFEEAKGGANNGIYGVNSATRKLPTHDHNFTVR